MPAGQQPPRTPRRLRRRLGTVLLGATVLGWLVAGGLARAAGPRAAPGAAAGSAHPGAVEAAPATPLLSVRRVPGWIEDSVAAQRLAPQLSTILDSLGPQAAQACLVVRQGGRTLFTDHALMEVLPASNMKLLTATAVLDKLGAKARLTTRVEASGPPRGGVVAGNLYLVGSGDPLLWTAQYDAGQDPPEPLYTSLAQLAAQVRAAGITTVDGSVVGDESLFDTQRGVPTWEPYYEGEGDVGPLSALEVNNGFLLTPPYGPAPQPAVMAAQVFTKLLKTDGVKVTGPGATGDTSNDAVAVTSIASPPLGQVVGAVLRVSDDTGAELLTKLLGRRFGAGGTTAAGIAVIRSDLAADGLPVSQLISLDGSGLDRGDRVTCNLIADDLQREGTGGALFAGLPVAGSTGTLYDRMNATPAAGRLHAKTGTLNDVSALSGFVLPAGKKAVTSQLDDPIVFSLILNGLTGTQNGETVGDRIGVALAEYPDIPALTTVAPVEAQR